jgi:hypothetical protein
VKFNLVVLSEEESVAQTRCSICRGLEVQGNPVSSRTGNSSTWFNYKVLVVRGGMVEGGEKLNEVRGIRGSRKQSRLC